jgi:ferrous iron transport protein A
MTLAESLQGQTVEVLKIRASGAIKQRMLDMGISRGAELTVERYAPLKDPIQIKVKGYSLALRVAEGSLIDVKLAG